MTSDSMKDIIARKLQSKTAKISPSLRAFAMTLHFYSAKAYNYVRKQFKNLLPHEKTIAKWYKVIDGNPGFTKQAFDSIAQKVKKEKNVIVNLTMDEMSIRENIHWDGCKFYGYTDLGIDGNDNQSEQVPKAKNALVFMAVALNSNWKVPIGYFLINSLNSIERANLLSKCLTMLHNTGAICNSITFDGAAVNLSMCTNLKCNFNYGKQFQPWFEHPVTKEMVHILSIAIQIILKKKK